MQLLKAILSGFIEVSEISALKTIVLFMFFIISL